LGLASPLLDDTGTDILHPVRHEVRRVLPAVLEGVLEALKSLPPEVPYPQVAVGAEKLWASVGGNRDR